MRNKVNLQIQVTLELKTAVEKIIADKTFGEKTIQDTVRDYLLGIAQRNIEPVFSMPVISPAKLKEYELMLDELRQEHQDNPNEILPTTVTELIDDLNKKKNQI